MTTVKISTLRQSCWSKLPQGGGLEVEGTQLG
jgi:hypothetical protein